jgi:hypothetical protein
MTEPCPSARRTCNPRRRRIRLLREPRRLWRRNLDSPAFLCRVLLDRLSRRTRRLIPPNAATGPFLVTRTRIQVVKNQEFARRGSALSLPALTAPCLATGPETPV